MEQSDGNFVNEKMDSYQDNDEFQSKLLGSYPQAKYIFLNYCRGTNFNTPECLKFYRGMYKKANEDGGNLDEDVHEHIKTTCYTKDEYVSDDKYYFSLPLIFWFTKNVNQGVSIRKILIKLWFSERKVYNQTKFDS